MVLPVYKEIVYFNVRKSLHMSIPQGSGTREQAVRFKDVGWLDAGLGYSAAGNNKPMDARHKVTSMLFVAKAELRQIT